MALTNFPYGVSSFGVPMVGGGIPMTGTSVGRYIFVDATYGSDGNDGMSWDTAVKTVAQAYSMATTNHDDVIVLSTNAVHTISSILDISKSRVHFVGDVYGRQYGQRARLYMGVTTAVTDIHMVRNTGVGNTFTGIKFWSDNTLTQNTSCVGEGGEYTVYRNCEFYDSTRLTSDTHAEVLLNGDSTQFYNCTFGSLADSVTGDKVRPAVITTLGGVAGGAGTSRDVLFDGCRFWKKAGGTTTAFVKILANAEIERVMEFHDCQFVANILGSTPAVAIASATSLTAGQVLLTGDTCGFDVTKLATATGIISCLNLKVATGTIGVQTT
jgi:hypothetical protein